MKQFLTTLVKDSRFIASNLITPYGYRIDFVIECDKDRHFIKPTQVDSNSSSLISKNLLDCLRFEL